MDGASYEVRRGSEVDGSQHLTWSRLSKPGHHVLPRDKFNSGCVSANRILETDYRGGRVDGDDCDYEWTREREKESSQRKGAEEEKKQMPMRWLEG